MSYALVLGMLSSLTPFLMVGTAPVAEASPDPGWHDPNWTYRRPVTINNTGSALTDYQVLVTNPVYDETGLVGSWHFNEGSGNVAVDSSGWGNEGWFDLIKSDDFDTKDTSFWTFDAYQEVPSLLDGRNVLKMWGPGNAWKGFYQTTANITTGQEVQFDFRRTGTSSWHMGAVETSDGNKRWCIQEDDKDNIRVQYNTGEGWVYPKNLITGAKVGVWYSAILRVDVNGFYMKVWEKGNPSVYGDYTYNMPTGLTWRFHSWQYKNVTGYLDAFRIRRFTTTTYPTWVDGKYGKALQFDGSDDYVDCGNGSSLDITDAITIEAWFKASAINRWQRIVSKQ